MAHKKAGGSTRQHPARAGKRLGIKLYAGQKAQTGSIVVRQKGSKVKPGTGVKMGRDFTLFATKDGVVSYKKKYGKVYAAIN
ncbi:50S ribosomal protein L27 [Candidatus Beckwithbacteria bacterium RBG_13_42_9]|uniref:Large ribosomal subunit protein bL27 n=1 Tax=Candidatus Beckwithbacteria bacterium RBG_13_42_9 TaxID=1797457 RepID=A0A1F5E7A0_9BACT|nr:MAG: 50S ribosomal protein L27 [Candidatus Beckwithbacteria bacterium RBG_13_42_9]